MSDLECALDAASAPETATHGLAPETRMRLGESGTSVDPAILVRAIAGEVIPRLMLMNTAAPADARKRPIRIELRGAEIAHFSRLLMAVDGGPAVDYVAELRRRGMSVESIMSDLFTAAARHIGELWESDACDFVDVTIGVGRLREMLRDLSPPIAMVGAVDGGRRVALLMPTTGEQHTLGIAMVEEVFRKDGWTVWGDDRVAPRGIADVLGSEPVDIAGFSLAAEVHLDALRADIMTAKKASRNQRVKIIVGGRAFVTHPGLAKEIGADGSATTAISALRLARKMMDSEARVCD